MLSFLLIGGLVWLVVALVFVLALAAAARPQVSPSTVAELETKVKTTESSEAVTAGEEGLLSAEAAVPT